MLENFINISTVLHLLKLLKSFILDPTGENTIGPFIVPDESIIQFENLQETYDNESDAQLVAQALITYEDVRERYEENSQLYERVGRRFIAVELLEEVDI